ncbi:MAG: recombinase family protein [Chloroflexi bacterium]|nr:recombinase family protein [Chloroflexota bacterium]MDL1883164.1 recombinase family protein [Anaerolineae bacterium CFX8]
MGYIRVSTDEQDLSKQKHLLLEYAQQQHIIIDQFIEAEVSSRKTPKERRIEELLDLLEAGDHLLVAELSRLGRNMLETLNIINALSERGIKITFVRQPELSTSGAHGKLLLAIYSYFAEAERDYISLRTKQGLAAARASGKLLGRPKGSRNKRGSVLTPYAEQIMAYLKAGVSIRAIQKLINPLLEKPVTYNTYKYFIYLQRGKEL